MRALTLWLLFYPLGLHGLAVRLKDLAQVQGVRENLLTGYGMVWGLSGTGDSSKALLSRKSAWQFLKSMGLTLELEELTSGSYASVLVSAHLPPFARNGQRLDVRVSLQGDAKSLVGGVLLLTPLLGLDGEVYAQAQGPLIQADGGQAQILLGATVEKELKFSPQWQKGIVTLSLYEEDFTTISQAVWAINDHYRGFYAEAKDSRNIEVQIPPPYGENPIAFLAELEQITVDKDTKALLAFNEKTGTLVMGQQILISPVTLTHGSLLIEVGHGGEKKPSSLAALLEAMKTLGAQPKDFMAVLQALHGAGAIQARMKIL